MKLPYAALGFIGVAALCARPYPVSGQKAVSSPPPVRWKSGNACCTLTRAADEKSNYGLRTSDLSVTVAVDPQELQLTRRRITHFLGVYVEARYEGTGSLVFDPGTATIEYASHYHVLKGSLDPDKFVERIETGAEEVSDEAGRQLEKHPEKGEKKEVVARAYQKDSAELVEFVNTKTMRSTTLSAGTPQVSGWILFGTDSRWIGKWKKREELIVRIPLSDRTLEFPFTLPPEGDVSLKHRD